MNKFNFYKYAGKRIKDRNIRWEEQYRERSTPLKARMDEEIGPGAYYRWEGHDYTTNSDYFIVVGPSQEKSGKKSFFSGIKKLPPRYKRDKVKSYAPSGEYFTNIISAIRHAVDKWGVRFPQNQTQYTDKDLQDVEIPRHIKG
jgi:hypothetical protein